MSLNQADNLNCYSCTGFGLSTSELLARSHNTNRLTNQEEQRMELKRCIFTNGAEARREEKREH